MGDMPAMILICKNFRKLRFYQFQAIFLECALKNKLIGKRTFMNLPTFPLVLVGEALEDAR